MQGWSVTTSYSVKEKEEKEVKNRGKMSRLIFAQVIPIQKTWAGYILTMI